MQIRTLAAVWRPLSLLRTSLHPPDSVPAHLLHDAKATGAVWSALHPIHINLPKAPLLPAAQPPLCSLHTHAHSHTHTPSLPGALQDVAASHLRGGRRTTQRSDMRKWLFIFPFFIARSVACARASFGVPLQRPLQKAAVIAARPGFPRAEEEF